MTTGTLLHPSYWPHEDLDLTGKKIAVIGTGSTGVQLTQELSRIAGQLTVFQRTPNMSLPMLQVDYNDTTENIETSTNTTTSEIPKSQYPTLYAARTQSFGGFDFNFQSRGTFDDTPSQRQQTYQTLWDQGDFKFWLANYHDMLFSTSANGSAYNFWRDKTRARIHDEKKREILAPLQQPHAFGCKRISLETSYFTAFNQPHVAVVDISPTGTPITSLTEKGIRTTTADYPFDYIIAATGYDALTGGLLDIDIRHAATGQTLRAHWTHATRTYLGMTVSGFPNLFFTYGPQAPTAFCNGPTCAELQGSWILNALSHLRANSLRKMEARAASETYWTQVISDLAGASLISGVESVSLPRTKCGGGARPGKCISCSGH